MFLKVKNAVNDRQRLIVKTLKVLFTFKERLPCNSQIGLCSERAEIEISGIFHIISCARTRAAFLTRLCHIKVMFLNIINMQSVLWIHVINGIMETNKKSVLFIQHPVDT